MTASTTRAYDSARLAGPRDRVLREGVLLADLLLLPLQRCGILG